MRIFNRWFERLIGRSSKKVVTLDENSKQNLLDELLKRSPNHYGEFSERVNAIIEDVKKNKDAALFSYTERFDGAEA